MRDLLQQKQLRIRPTSLIVGWLAFSLIFSPAFAANSSGTSLNQTEAQVLNAELNRRGSDSSLQNSTVFAMQALMDLASTKIPSAVSNGLNAYGKFRNSENLDRLKDGNVAFANSMVSVGGGPVVPGQTGPTNTSFRRLSPAFLRQGEAAKVAGEFEKRTGMPREEFLKELSSISEQKIKRSDPLLVDKSLARLEGFIAKIPNAEFRKSLEKNIALVPDSMRRGMVAKAVAKFASFVADSGPSTEPNMPSTVTAAAQGTPDAYTPVAGIASDPAATAGKPGEENRAIASLGGSLGATPTLDGKGREPAKDYKDPLSNAVRAAIESTETRELTIFQIVSRRYRILTPLVSKGP